MVDDGLRAGGVRRRGHGGVGGSGVRVDRERAWDALLRDKKGALNLVLLGDDGGYVTHVPEADVKRALDELIAD